MRTIRRQLDLRDLVGTVLPALWRGEIDRRRTLWSTPSALADEKPTAHDPCIHLAGFLVDDQLFRLDHRAGLALVVDAEHFGAELEFAALGSHGQGLQELDLALSIKHPPGVEFRYPWDRVGCLCGVEVDYFLGRLFECCSQPRIV